MRFDRVLLVVGLLLCMAGCDGNTDGSVTGQRIAQPRPGEWPSYGRSYDEQRFAPLEQINRKTVSRLGLTWWAEVDTDRGQEATPLMVDGVLYTTTAWSKVYAYEARTGRALWHFDPKVPGDSGFNACCDVVNRGAAIWKEHLFIGTLDGRLIALDRKTGRQIWSVQTTDPSQPYTITGAPRVVNGKVLIGNGGAEYGVRGYVSAYDTETGKLVWRFYTTPNPKGEPDQAASDSVLANTAAATWSEGAWRESGGGGTVWDSIVYDAVNDLILIGVGNGTPWNHKIRSGGQGDNLFLTAIVALRPQTGEYVWHYQTTPGESWDYTATQPLMLADLNIAGTQRRVVMQAPKNGFFYVLDAASGRLISADKFVPVTWADRIDLTTGRPVESEGARYENEGQTLMPGALGAHNWQPMAFSPSTGLVYIPAQQSTSTYDNPTSFQYIPGAWNMGLKEALAGPSAASVTTDEAAPPSGELIAWDPVSRRARWRVSFPISWTSGVLATQGGLVFHAAGRRFVAYDAADGRELWSYDTVASAIAPAISYAIDGEQYVALMVGYGGAAFDQPRRRGRLMVFKLDGSTTPTAFAEPFVQPLLDLSSAVPGQGDADRGGAVYMRHCTNCHGWGPLFPDLPRSPSILHPDSFKLIVMDGALRQRGMISFSRFLKPQDVEDLRTYLLWHATKAAEQSRTEAVKAQTK